MSPMGVPRSGFCLVPMDDEGVLDTTRTHLRGRRRRSRKFCEDFTLELLN